MPVNNNAIDNLFYEKEAERVADTSQMQQHWQAMQQMLPAAQQPILKTGRPGLLKWVAGFSLVAVVATYIILRSTGGTAAVAEKNTGAPAVSNTELAENTLPVTNTPIPVPDKETGYLPATVPPASKKTVDAGNRVVTGSPERPSANTSKVATDAAFDEFYIHLSRPPQVFSIETGTDTVLKCKEGTNVKIPAMVFTDQQGNQVTGGISLIVQEYYRYEDIIVAGIKAKNGRPVITAGMVKVDAYRGEEKLQIGQGRSIEIQMHPGIDKSVRHTQTATAPADTALVAKNQVAEILSSKTINTLGWISNDGQYEDTRPKTNLTIQFSNQHDPQQFMSQLAFANAVMSGYIDGQQIVFSNVPVGETVYLVSLGNVNNKYLSCIKKIVVGGATVSGITFAETSPEKFKQQLELLTSLPVKE